MIPGLHSQAAMDAMMQRYINNNELLAALTTSRGINVSAATQPGANNTKTLATRLHTT